MAMTMGVELLMSRIALMAKLLYGRGESKLYGRGESKFPNGIKISLLGAPFSTLESQNAVFFPHVSNISDSYREESKLRTIRPPWTLRYDYLTADRQSRTHVNRFDRDFFW